MQNSEHRQLITFSILTLLIVCFSSRANAESPEKAASSLSGPAPKTNYKVVKIEGEVVDAWCWSSGVMGSGRGPEHHSCGLACVMGGVSCGIVDDNDKLYIAAKSKAYKGANQMLAKYVAHRVIVNGWSTERGGCTLLKVNDVKDLGPAEKFYKKAAKKK
ncbi:MAG: hypothetical protein K2X27_28425 [Candidatus Obscuribacterales bacterium]|nr:hypothetical protein [Candidatus Obscuribacterales bacterium]